MYLGLRQSSLRLNENGETLRFRDEHAARCWEQEHPVYMPTFERLPPRFRDSRTAMVSRDLRRLVPIPPSAPFVAPFRIQPSPSPLHRPSGVVGCNFAVRSSAIHVS